MEERNAAYVLFFESLIRLTVFAIPERLPLLFFIIFLYRVLSLDFFEERILLNHIEIVLSALLKLHLEQATTRLDFLFGFLDLALGYL